jgi:hypothetical protein
LVDSWLNCVEPVGLRLSLGISILDNLESVAVLPLWKAFIFRLAYSLVPDDEKALS